jgi:hypothetical protein
MKALRIIRRIVLLICEVQSIYDNPSVSLFG